MRRIGALMNIGADDPEAPALVGAFSQGLGESGWIIGRNAQGAEAARAYAAELLALTPDTILASATPGTMAVKQLTRTVPIVFTRVADPVGSGIVDSLARTNAQGKQDSWCYLFTHRNTSTLTRK
jgi:putative ABC transport system substrate-binding protein